MSLLNSLKDAVVGQAMKLAASPRVTKVNAAMKAMSLGGTVKSGMDKCGRVAAGTFGLATQDEVANLRSTIQTLEDTVATLEAKNAAAAAAAAAAPAPAPEKKKKSTGAA
jgi:hypothetical protein